ncbi:unnamed protein product [Ectocarpus fasciculatus]
MQVETAGREVILARQAVASSTSASDARRKAWVDFSPNGCHPLRPRAKSRRDGVHRLPDGSTSEQIRAARLGEAVKSGLEISTERHEGRLLSRAEDFAARLEPEPEPGRAADELTKTCRELTRLCLEYSGCAQVVSQAATFGEAVRALKGADVSQTFRSATTELVGLARSLSGGVLGKDAFSAVAALLQHVDVPVRSAACVALRRLMRNGERQVELLMSEPKLMETLKELARVAHGHDGLCKGSAAVVQAGIAFGSDHQVQSLLQQLDWLKMLETLFRVGRIDAGSAVDGISRIIRCSNPDSEDYKTSMSLLGDYFVECTSCGAYSPRPEGRTNSGGAPHQCGCTQPNQEVVPGSNVTDTQDSATATGVPPPPRVPYCRGRTNVQTRLALPVRGLPHTPHRVAVRWSPTCPWVNPLLPRVAGARLPPVARALPGTPPPRVAGARLLPVARALPGTPPPRAARPAVLPAARGIRGQPGPRPRAQPRMTAVARLRENAGPDKMSLWGGVGM